MKTKKELIENLIREGHIGLDEALILLETEKEYISVPYQFQPLPYVPFEIHPLTIPVYPEPMRPFYGDRYKITCGTGTGHIGLSRNTIN